MRLRHPLHHVLGLAIIASTARAALIDYGREVRPILADNCFHCHGQDAEARKGKLRLDTREGQRREGIIVAGKPAESELIARISSPHEDEWMPPPESNRTLNDAQKETLRRWIAEGAPFGEHWAFAALKRPPLPELRRRTRQSLAGSSAAPDPKSHDFGYNG